MVVCGWVGWGSGEDFTETDYILVLVRAVTWNI